MPKYVRYKGFSWHVVANADGLTATLSIIGFNNRHTLTWGIKALEAALADGTMIPD